MRICIATDCAPSFLSTSAHSDCPRPPMGWGGGGPTEQDNQYAVPLKLKCVFPFYKKSKSPYSELSFEKSIHPLKFMDSRFQIVPPLAGSQVTALYNPSLNNIHHDKWHHNSDIHNQSLL